MPYTSVTFCPLCGAQKWRWLGEDLGEEPPCTTCMRTKPCYVYLVKDDLGTTFGITNSMEHRMPQEFERRHHPMILGAWKFKNRPAATEAENRLKSLMGHGRIHGVIIAAAGRWTESVRDDEAEHVQAIMDRTEGVRVTWPTFGAWRRIFA